MILEIKINTKVDRMNFVEVFFFSRYKQFNLA